MRFLPYTHIVALDEGLFYRFSNRLAYRDLSQIAKHDRGCLLTERNHHYSLAYAAEHLANAPQIDRYYTLPSQEMAIDA